MIEDVGTGGKRLQNGDMMAPVEFKALDNLPLVFLMRKELRDFRGCKSWIHATSTPFHKDRVMNSFKLV